MNNSSYLTCPLCGKSIKVTKSHINRSHKDLGYEEFVKEYPEFPRMTDDFLASRVRIMTMNNSNPEFVAKRQSAQTAPNKIRAALSNLSKIDKVDNARAARLRMIAYNKSPQGLEMAKRNMTARHKDPEYTHSLAVYGKYGHHCSVTLDSGEVLNVRSRLEQSVILKLLSYHIEFKYESLSVPYIDPNDQLTHNYIPDLLIGDNLVLEIKPSNQVDDPTVQAKKLAVQQLGYEFSFITSPEDLNFLIESATTIERVTE